MRAVKGLLKLVGILLAILLSIEGYFRFVLKEAPVPFENRIAESFAKLIEFDQVTGTHYRINTDQLIESPTDDFSILYKTNEINLRDRAMGTHLRQELKFLVFGDEFAEGWGSDIDRTFVVQAQNKVNEITALKPPVRLVIAAQSGFGAAQNYLVAKKLLETIPPKGVIFFYSSLMPHADHLFLRDATLVDGLATGIKPDVPTTPRLPHLEDHPKIEPSVLTRLAESSVVVHRAVEILAARAAANATKVGDPASDRLAGMRAVNDQLGAVHEPSLRHVLALAELAKAHDAPFVLIHLPLPPQVSAKEWTGGRKLFKVAAGLRSSNDVAMIEKFCADNQIKCISLHRAMQEAATQSAGAPMFHRNEIALSLPGATWLGEWLAKEILGWMVELGYRS